MTGKITDMDRGLNRVAALLARKAQVKVGILSDAPKQAEEGKSSDMSLLEVAALHEFGAPAAHIPQRSFIRATVDENLGTIREIQSALSRRIVQGQVTPEQAMDQLGAKVSAMIQQRIARGIDPPLKPETIARKKSDKPLIDTGQLRSSITWKVETKK